MIWMDLNTELHIKIHQHRIHSNSAPLLISSNYEYTRISDRSFSSVTPFFFVGEKCMSNVTLAGG